ncbi:LLM class flavin-dependent oxidoreductase [Streptomyces sp. BG9H]|uniref:LLM class flavin-dependent oxidoreductase n=1 Tax=Streptomyces anatolicus TaxID=2675858 RepID=A0ABS6YPU9_9ACTN|nr:LLM class flavin-dependent oxidoreductase [Streptomyces anatolicus]MBW5423456.1 LLM class flavin-dependent oxidoreductase [Streptomyces anatolicus]
MTASAGRGPLHLAAALDRPGAHEAAPYAELAELSELAERGALDFVTLGGGSDALAVAARIAPRTGRVGLVPAVPAIPTAPAALDRVSGGRAGWLLDASAAEAEARLFGSRCPAPHEEPPHDHPVRVVDATAAPARETAARHADVALVRAASARQADAARAELRCLAGELGRDPDTLRVFAALVVDLGGGECAAAPGHGGGPRPTAEGPAYRGGPVDLAELIADWHRAGAVDGFHLTPVEPRRDLERLVNGTVALLQHRGLFRTFYPGSTLRDHLGLRVPVWKG